MNYQIVKAREHGQQDEAQSLCDEQIIAQFQSCFVLCEETMQNCMEVPASQITLYSRFPYKVIDYRLQALFEWYNWGFTVKLLSLRNSSPI